MLVWFSLPVIEVSETENKFQKEVLIVSDKEQICFQKCIVRESRIYCLYIATLENSQTEGGK